MKIQTRLTTLLAVLTLAGCAAPADPSAMAVRLTPAADAKRSSQGVRISVLGGRQTSQLGPSSIADEDFAAALGRSLLDDGVFRRLEQGEASGYGLRAVIVNLEQPWFALRTKVEMEVSYSLTDQVSGAEVWKQTIRSSYTTTPLDTLDGMARLRLANEGAARRNIAAALVALERVPLY